MLGLVDQLVPALQLGRRGVQAQFVADQAVQTLLVQHARHFVDGVHVPHGDHAPLRHVREQRYFFALFVGNAAVSTAQQHVGLNTDLAQLLGRVLGRLGFKLAGGGDPGHVAQMHKGGVVGAHAQTHLAHSLQKGQGFDVADRAADLDNRYVDGFGGVIAGPPLDEILDFVGDVRNHLNCLAQVVAAALFLEHAFIDLAGGEVVGLAHARFNETLVVAQVQVGFGAVFGDKHLAVLKR